MSRVYLVGAGPGDPELLTVKALFLLRRADLVLHDALISRDILDLIPKTTKLIDVGKRCGQKLLSQGDINALLVHAAQTTEIVVRLKGGDPTIFGRVGEEIAALRQAGVAYEIVPGVTSASASAAAAGISLTDRRFASSVVFTTAHRGAAAEAAEWDRLVTSNSTLVIYMPGRDNEALARQLMTAGIQLSTPCAIVSRAASQNQSVYFTSLDQLGKLSTPAPSLLIVGRCAGELTESTQLEQFVQAHRDFASQNSLSY